MFESPEKTEPTSLEEEEKNRKESFQKAREKFKDVDGDVDLTDPCEEVDSANDCSYDNEVDSNTEVDEETENERRKTEFKAKQQLFDNQNSC